MKDKQNGESTEQYCLCGCHNLEYNKTLCSLCSKNCHLQYTEAQQQSRSQLHFAISMGIACLGMALVLGTLALAQNKWVTNPAVYALMFLSVWPGIVMGGYAILKKLSKQPLVKMND